LAVFFNVSLDLARVLSKILIASLCLEAFLLETVCSFGFRNPIDRLSGSLAIVLLLGIWLGH
jgi:hypothetical protein